MALEIEKKYGKNEIFRNFVYNFLKRYKYMICVENCDAEFNGNYAKFAEYCIKRINQRSCIINKNELKVEEILISPFLFFKSSNINGGFNFDGYDAIVFSEKPIINVCSENVYNDSMKHSYDTRLVGFNNPDLLEWWKEGRTDEEFYEYCKKHDYKIKIMFSNIMVDEKMCLFGVQWIPENMRKEHEIDIINFFKNI